MSDAIRAAQVRAAENLVVQDLIAMGLIAAPQDKAHPSPPAVPSEPRGCPTPGACSSIAAIAERAAVLEEAAQVALRLCDHRPPDQVADAIRRLAAPVASPEPKQEGALLMALAVIREITGTQQENIEATVDAVRALAAPVASNTTAEPAPIQPAGVEVERDAARYRAIESSGRSGTIRIDDELAVCPRYIHWGGATGLDLGAAIDQALAGGAAK